MLVFFGRLNNPRNERRRAFSESGKLKIASRNIVAVPL